MTASLVVLCLLAEPPPPVSDENAAREDLDRALTLKGNGGTVAITGGMMFGASVLGALGTLAVGNGDVVIYKSMVTLAGVSALLVTTGLIVRGVGRIRQRKALRRLDEMAAHGGFVIRF